MARKRLRELRYGKDVIDPVAQLVLLHLRFYGYRSAEWTDSAVRRYVDAGAADATAQARAFGLHDAQQAQGSHTLGGTGQVHARRSACSSSSS